MIKSMRPYIERLTDSYYDWLKDRCLEAIEKGKDLIVWHKPFDGMNIESISEYTTTITISFQYLLAEPNSPLPPECNTFYPMTHYYLNDLKAIAYLSSDEVDKEALRAWLKNLT